MQQVHVVIVVTETKLFSLAKTSDLRSSVFYLSLIYKYYRVSDRTVKRSRFNMTQEEEEEEADALWLDGGANAIQGVKGSGTGFVCSNVFRYLSPDASTSASPAWLIIYCPSPQSKVLCATTPSLSRVYTVLIADDLAFRLQFRERSRRSNMGRLVLNFLVGRSMAILLTILVQSPILILIQNIQGGPLTKLLSPTSKQC